MFLPQFFCAQKRAWLPWRTSPIIQMYRQNNITSHDHLGYMIQVQTPKSHNTTILILAITSGTKFTNPRLGSDKLLSPSRHRQRELTLQDRRWIPVHNGCRPYTSLLFMLVQLLLSTACGNRWTGCGCDIEYILLQRCIDKIVHVDRIHGHPISSLQPIRTIAREICPRWQHIFLREQAAFDRTATD